MNHSEKVRRKLMAALGAGTFTGTLGHGLSAFAQAQPKPADKIWRVGLLA